MALRLDFPYYFSNDNLETLGTVICGHDLLDLTVCGRFLAGKLVNYKPEQIEVMAFSH